MSDSGSPSRLHPPRWHARYYGLVRLRQALERALANHVAPRAAAARLPLAVDLGCGTAPYRSLLLPHVERYLGVDTKDNPAADLTIGADGRVPLADGCADVVLSTQVLEHVESPEAYLAEARRLCRRDGLLLLSAPGFYPYHAHPDDYWRWTASGLRKLLVKHGFVPRQTTGVLGFAAAAFGLLQDAIVDKLPPVRIVRLATSACLQQVVGALDLLYTEKRRQENATCYLVVAQRS